MMEAFRSFKMDTELLVYILRTIPPHLEDTTSPIVRDIKCIDDIKIPRRPDEGLNRSIFSHLQPDCIREVVAVRSREPAGPSQGRQSPSHRKRSRSRSASPRKKFTRPSSSDNPSSVGPSRLFRSDADRSLPRDSPPRHYRSSGHSGQSSRPYSRERERAHEKDERGRSGHRHDDAGYRRPERAERWEEHPEPHRSRDFPERDRDHRDRRYIREHDREPVRDRDPRDRRDRERDYQRERRPESIRERDIRDRDMRGRDTRDRERDLAKDRDRSQTHRESERIVRIKSEVDKDRTKEGETSRKEEQSKGGDGQGTSDRNVEDSPHVRSDERVSQRGGAPLGRGGPRGTMPYRPPYLPIPPPGMGPVPRRPMFRPMFMFPPRGPRPFPPGIRPPPRFF